MLMKICGAMVLEAAPIAWMTAEASPRPAPSCSARLMKRVMITGCAPVPSPSGTRQAAMPLGPVAVPQIRYARAVQLCAKLTWRADPSASMSRAAREEPMKTAAPMAEENLPAPSGPHPKRSCMNRIETVLSPGYAMNSYSPRIAASRQHSGSRSTSRAALGPSFLATAAEACTSAFWSWPPGSSAGASPRRFLSAGCVSGRRLDIPTNSKAGIAAIMA
mmetsp:Transcript_99913/g.258190  ORF Transcript_99913/g.258190 Transcript_99913/m.258190 type:complete len:219 (-) Transcript_99913:556-1212(-)